MRGVDGNYLNTQGDALARMQVAYQGEQNRQQIRAQLEAADTLRKLREQVNEPEKKDASSGPQEVKDDRGSSSQAFPREGGGREKAGQPKPPLGEGENPVEEMKKTHIDIRI